MKEGDTVTWTHYARGVTLQTRVRIISISQDKARVTFWKGPDYARVPKYLTVPLRLLEKIDKE
jgi:hypothetical protein